MADETKTQKQQIFSAVVILTFSNLFVKLIGLLFKIPLQAVIADEGMGYFNAAYSIYVWFYTISTAGLPVAVSLLVAKSYARCEKENLSRIFTTTMYLLGAVGAVCSIAMWAGADVFAKWIGSPSTAQAIRVISPAIFFVCISGGIRGYYQGMGNMIPTAVSQVVEAVCKLGLGIALSLYAVRHGYDLPTCAAFAVSGLTVGCGVGMILLLAVKSFAKPVWEEGSMESTATEPKKRILRRLCGIALPVTLSASVMSLTGLIDVLVVIRRLRATGLAEEAAVALYGNYTTLAMPMFNLPPTLITPIACAIVPALTAAYQKKDTAAQAQLRASAMQTTCILILPCAVGLSVMAHPILSLFFAQPSVNLAAPLLSVLALSTPFVAITSITNSFLQVYHKERKPIFAMLAGAAVKLLASYLLIGNPRVGIYGTPIGTLLCYFCIACVSLYYVTREIGALPSVFALCLKPFAASVLAVALSALTRHLLLGSIGATFATLIALAVAVISYFLSLVALKGIGENEIEMLPKGDKILHLLRRVGLFRVQKET